MSVSVNTVYQRVLAVLNKEQRGYVTPQEFNLFANQAQMDIFEQYFYDINQFGRIQGNDTEFSDMLTILNEKINPFEVTGNMTYGASLYLTPPANLYRIGTLIYNNIEVERINQNEFLYINASPLTKPTDSRPIFVSSSTGYKVYGSDIVRTSNSVVKTAINGNDVFEINAANPRIIVGSKVTGTGIPAATTVTGVNAANTIITISEVVVLASGVTLTFTTPQKTQLITTGVTCNYLERPATVVWNYATVNGAALFNTFESVDFPLHPSEETELVIKILEFASLSVRDMSLYQVSNQMEGQNTQQEKS